MEESAYLTSFAAGIFFGVAGYRLLRLSWRTRELPELLLGLYFAGAGQWYLIYNAPNLFGSESLSPLMEHAVEWVYALGVIPYLLFIRMAFRPRSTGSTVLVAIGALLVITGCVASSLGGGFSNAIHDPAYLTEWVGYTLPCIWICCEGAISHAAARKRVRVGLCEPMVANRYLLFACFGFFQTCGCAVEILWASGNPAGTAASSISFGILGGTESASVAVLWLAFFPPRFYSAWIARNATALATPEEG